MDDPVLRLSLHSNWRKLRTGLALAVIALLAAGCGGSHGSHSSKWKPVAQVTTNGTISIADYWRTFSSRYLSFRYPANWQARTRGLVIDASFFSDIVALSPQPMQNSCTVKRTREFESVTCHSPVSHLRRNSMVATWSSDGFPSWKLSMQPGQKIKVGGITGKWDMRSATGEDTSDGATELVTVVVPIPRAPDNFYELYTELRGADTAALLAELRTMVITVRWIPEQQ